MSLNDCLNSKHVIEFEFRMVWKQIYHHIHNVKFNNIRAESINDLEFKNDGINLKKTLIHRVDRKYLSKEITLFINVKFRV